LAKVEKNKPSARFAAMNTNESAYSSFSEPTSGTSNTSLPASKISDICT
jgi:hypothetical protein